MSYTEILEDIQIEKEQEEQDEKLEEKHELKMQKIQEEQERKLEEEEKDVGIAMTGKEIL